MIITTKGRYALHAMIALAKLEEGERVPLKDITAGQDLSLKYMESIMTVLSKGGLVESASGKGGGYKLTRKPKEYSVGEILRLAEGNISPVSCQALDGKECDHEGSCITLPFWRELGDLINDYLDKHSLYDLVHMSKA